MLTRTLLETKQAVPDFLQKYMPAGKRLTSLKFEADSDFEEDEEEAQVETQGGDVGNTWGGAAATEDNSWP